MTARVLIRSSIVFAVAPLVPTAAVAILFDLRDALFYLAVFGYPAVVLVGVPTHFLVRWLGWNGGFVYLVAGFMAGILWELLYGIGLMLREPPASDVSLLTRVLDTLRIAVEGPELALVIGSCGPVAALTLWLIIESDRNPSVQ